jgi:hypothetical protein
VGAEAPFEFGCSRFLFGQSVLFPAQLLSNVEQYRLMLQTNSFHLRGAPRFRVPGSGCQLSNLLGQTAHAGLEIGDLAGRAFELPLFSQQLSLQLAYLRVESILKFGGVRL